MICGLSVCLGVGDSRASSVLADQEMGKTGSATWKQEQSIDADISKSWWILASISQFLEIKYTVEAQSWDKILISRMASKRRSP